MIKYNSQGNDLPKEIEKLIARNLKDDHQDLIREQQYQQYAADGYNVLAGFFNAKGAGDGWNKADRHILQPIEAHQNALDNPSANTVILCGTKSKPYNSTGLLIVDVDIKNTRNQQDKDDCYQALKKLLGDIADHPTVITATGGYHFYIAVPHDQAALIPNIAALLLASGEKINGKYVWEIELLSTGKLVQAIPTTLTINGKKTPYQWGSGIVLNVIPDLLINAINTAQTPKASKTKLSNEDVFATVKRAAQGRWPAIFSRLGITLPPDNKHAPCPACGGKDRFRYDDIDGHGTFICNQGGNHTLSGDGFALIQHKTGATSSEVLNMVRSIVLPDYQKKPFEPKQNHTTQSTDEEAIETHRNAPRGNDAMLYGIFGDFGRIAAKNTEVNPYAAAFNSMIYLSSAIGRDVFFYIGNDIHHVRLFGLHIGRSSQGQKGGAHSLLNRVEKHLAEREPTLAPRKHTGGLSSREGLAALLHDGYMDGKQEVEPITDKRLFIRESEFANVMHQASRNGNTLSAALRDGWDGIGSQPATKHRGMWSSNPHIAIAAACTPVELITLTTKNDVSNGFLNRFVIFWAERTARVPFPESTPQHTVEDLAQRLSNVIAFAKGDYCWDTNPSLAVENTRQITLSDEAKKVYGHIYIKVFPKFNDGEKVTALTERKAPYLLRIAALFALSDFSLVIEAHHINAAHEWIKYWHESVKFIFNDEAEEVENSQIAINAEKILDYLKSKGSKHKATQTELSENVFNKHASSKEINAAISSLLSTTPPQIEVLTGERADGSNGRKPKLYALFKNSQNPCEISEISEITTAATKKPKFAKCEISEISEISPLNSQTDDGLNSEITLNSQTSQTSQSVRNNENPTASSNFANFANFADTCEDREVF